MRRMTVRSVFLALGLVACCGAGWADQSPPPSIGPFQPRVTGIRPVVAAGLHYIYALNASYFEVYRRNPDGTPGPLAMRQTALATIFAPVIAKLNATMTYPASSGITPCPAALARQAYNAPAQGMPFAADGVGRLYQWLSLLGLGGRRSARPQPQFHPHVSMGASSIVPHLEQHLSDLHLKGSGYLEADIGKADLSLCYVLPTLNAAPNGDVVTMFHTYPAKQAPNGPYQASVQYAVLRKGQSIYDSPYLLEAGQGLAPASRRCSRYRVRRRRSACPGTIFPWHRLHRREGRLARCHRSSETVAPRRLAAPFAAMDFGRDWRKEHPQSAEPPLSPCASLLPKCITSYPSTLRRRWLEHFATFSSWEFRPPGGMHLFTCGPGNCAISRVGIRCLQHTSCR